MNIQRSILEEAARLYFENKDWKGYIRKAVREQRKSENRNIERDHQIDKRHSK